MFCHQYPTGACVTGNSEVRSLRDNVSSLRMGGNLIGRSGCDGQPQGGRGLGWGGKVNGSEVLINVVMNDKRKRLRRLDQKGKGAGLGAPNSPSADAAPPAERHSLPHSWH